ncbi:MAG: cupin domain-containing protein [Propionibacteriaceae bacterium]|jgi:ethanolamine utilization protein EutQ|nr:cupin domain-containing protein [Propionibacteriaceae bacterium]
MKLSKEAIEGIIREVIREELGQAGGPAKTLDPSGVIGVDPARVPLEVFPFPIETDPPGRASAVKLIDLLTLDESPRLGCGTMELDACSFEWTLTYDEIDFVVDGTLDIITDGRPTRATAGQVIFIPKNTTVRFSTPDHVRFLYVCYPANWSDQ